MKQRIIYLVGARASGKTTLGEMLARKLGLDFVDTDRHLGDRCGMTVAEIVEREGWEGFRKRERETLREAARPGAVVATGGGMVLSEDNRNHMRATGTVVYLAAPADVLAARLAASPHAAQRPSLTGKSVLDEVADILAERSPLYESTAHLVVDASQSPEALLESTLRQLLAPEQKG